MPDQVPRLTEDDATLVAEARRAVLTTIDARDGRPRSVPICSVLIGSSIYSPLDEKPKAGRDPHRLKRVRNLTADPRATILVDHWDEEWTRLGFVELDCRGVLVEPGEAGHADAVAALRAKYQQSAGHRLEALPMLRFAILAAISWRGEPHRPPGPPAPAAAATRPQLPPRPR